MSDTTDRLLKLADRALEGDPTARFAQLFDAAREKSPDGQVRADTVRALTEELAEAQVERQWWSTLKSVLKAGRPADIALKMAINQVLRGPDDTWSGRGNDLRRVEFAALARWTERLQEELQFG